MPTKIPVGRGWFARVFPGFVGPEAVDEIAVFTTPYEGTDRWSGLQATSVTTPGATFLSDSGIVPAEKSWFIPWASGYHDDPAAGAARLTLSVVFPNGFWVGVTSSEVSNAANQVVSAQRAFILPARCLLRCQTSVQIAIASNLVLRFASIEIPAGEYVPGL